MNKSVFGNWISCIFTSFTRLKTVTPFFSAPNILSLLRIFCIPPFIFFVNRLSEHDYCRYITIFIILIAGLSDIFDGYLARRMNTATIFGTYLDSIADKLLFLPACFLLSMEKIMPEPRFPVWLLIIILFKDLFMNTFAAIAVAIITGKTFRPSLFGKISTFLLVSTIIAVLIGNFIPERLIDFVCWLTAICTVISIIHYAYMAINQLKFKFFSEGYIH